MSAMKNIAKGEIGRLLSFVMPESEKPLSMVDLFGETVPSLSESSKIKNRESTRAGSDDKKHHHIIQCIRCYFFHPRCYFAHYYQCRLIMFGATICCDNRNMNNATAAAIVASRSCCTSFSG